MAQLKQISCDPTCGFLLRSHNEKEILDLTLQHAKRSHAEMKITAGAIKKMIKNA